MAIRRRRSIRSSSFRWLLKSSMSRRMKKEILVVKKVEKRVAWQQVIQWTLRDKNEFFRTILLSTQRLKFDPFRVKYYVHIAYTDSIKYFVLHELSAVPSKTTYVVPRTVFTESLTIFKGPIRPFAFCNILNPMLKENVPSRFHLIPFCSSTINFDSFRNCQTSNCILDAHFLTSFKAKYLFD